MKFFKRVVIEMEIETNAEESANMIVDAVGLACNADDFVMPIIVEAIEANQLPSTKVQTRVFRQTKFT